MSFKNKAAVYLEPGTVKIGIQDLEKPSPAVGQVLVKLSERLFKSQIRVPQANSIQNPFRSLPFRLGNLQTVLAHSTLSNP